MIDLTCEAAREAVSARLDGELGAAEIGPVDAHLAECESCVAFIESAERLQRRIRVGAAPAVPDLTEAILATTGGLGRTAPPEVTGLRRTGRDRRLGPVAVAAAAVVIAGLAALLTISLGGAEPLPELAVAEAFVGETEQLGALYVTVVNRGGSDELVAASSPQAARVSFHVTENRGGLTYMTPVSSMDVDSQATLILAPTAGHLMLEEMAGPLAPGDTVDLVLTFARSGEVEVRADVVSWSEVVDRAQATS